MARGDGIRMQMAAIPGITLGKTADLLSAPFRFQCPPLDSFQHSHGHNFTRSTNYQGRETIRRGGKKLISIPVRTIIVEYATFAVEQRWDLEAMRDALITISEEGYPFRLLCTHQYGDTAEIDTFAVCEALNVTEQAGEVDARYLDLTFTEYDDNTVTRASNRRSGSGPNKTYPFTITLRKDGTYTVAGKPKGFFPTHGEALTFEIIAKYAYGAPSLAYFVAGSQSPKITDWGMRTALIKHARFKKGGKILVPAPPDIHTDKGGSVPRKAPTPKLTISR